MPLDTAIQTALDSIQNQVNDFINSSTEEAEKHGKLGVKNQQAMDRIEKTIGELGERILDVEQKAVAQGGVNEPIASIGNQFVNSDQFEQFRNGSSQKARFEIQNNTITGSDATVAPDRLGGVVAGASRRLLLADLIPGGQTSSNSIEYTRENVFTNNAAETAENVLKPESDVTFELVTAPVRTIAHIIKLSKQVVDDAPMIASYVDGRMRYGVMVRYDGQLLNGDGTAPNLSGLRDTGNFTAFTPNGTDPIVSIRQAITDVLQADYAPTGVILNPADCEAIDLVKGSDGHYVAANPRNGQPASIWGLPIVETNQMTAGQFQVGAYDIASQRFERQGVIVELFEQDEDNVQKNLLTMRAEMRAALAIYRPASLVGGALST